MTQLIQDKIANILEEEHLCFRKTEKGWERLFDDAILTVELVEMTDDNKSYLVFKSDFLDGEYRVRTSGSKLFGKIQRRISILEKRMRKRIRQINREKREKSGIKSDLKMKDIDPEGGGRLRMCSRCHKTKPDIEITFDDTPVFPRYICESCYRKIKK